MSEGTDRKTDKGQTKFQKEDGSQKIFCPSCRQTSAGTDRTDRGEMKLKKEEGGRKYFVQAADGRQKEQTEKQTEGR